MSDPIPPTTTDVPRRPRDRQQVPGLYAQAVVDLNLAEQVVDDPKLNGAEFHLRRAQVRATLLLANETRVANLIGLASVLVAGDSTVDGENRLRIVEERIYAALGLDVETTL